MRRLILLDSGVIGLLIHPGRNPDAIACSLWLDRVASAGISVEIPLVCYFEVRRESERLRLNDPVGNAKRPTLASVSVIHLERLARRPGFPKFDVKTMIVASRLWAEARRRGLPTAPDDALDADVILAATALRASRGGRDVWVVTTNVDHLARYVPACRWAEYPID